MIKAAPKAVAHLRAQLERKRLGLIFGAGLSKDLRFPDWNKLVRAIANHPDVKALGLVSKFQGADRASTNPRKKRTEAAKKSLASITQMLFGVYRKNIIHRRRFSEPLTFLQEQEVRSDWLEIIHGALYGRIDRAKGATMKCAEASPRLKAYYAAPLFNDMERTFNEGLVKRMEEYLEVFLPQRDGGLMMQLVKQGIAPAVAEKAVFQKDLEAMLKADMIVAILDGANVDEGVAFEIGYMYALDKYLIGLQTDMRRVLPTGNNPMIAASLNLVCTSTADLLDAIRDYCSGSPKECNKPVGRLARQDRVGAKIT